MPRIIDAIGPNTGPFINGSGQGTSEINGVTGNIGPAHAYFDAKWGRTTFSGEYGRDAVGYRNTYSPGRKNKTIDSLLEHMTRAYGKAPSGGYTSAQQDDFWTTVAANGTFANGHNLDAYCLDFVQKLLDGGATYDVIRIQREAAGALNECPILTEDNAYRAVTFYRRIIPAMRAKAATGGLKLDFLWNICSGPDAEWNGQSVAFPGWIDDNGQPLIDAIGPDTYSGTSLGGIYPIMRLWRNVTLANGYDPGVTTIARNQYEAPLYKNDVVVVGVGTANAETLTIASDFNGTRNVTFTTATTARHEAGDRITKVYAVGDLMQWYGVIYQSKINGNTAAPPNNAGVETAEWHPLTYAEWPDSLKSSARTAWLRAFRRIFYGENLTGTVDATLYVERWYRFARGDISGFTLDARVDPATVRNLDFYLPEWGAMSRPDTHGPTSGDAFVWAQCVFAWMAAKKAADGQGVKGWLLWDHDDGDPGDWNSVYSFDRGFPHQRTAYAAYHTEMGRIVNSLVHPSAQLRVQRRRGNRRTPAGTQ